MDGKNAPEKVSPVAHTAQQVTREKKYKKRFHEIKNYS